MSMTTDMVLASWCFGKKIYFIQLGRLLKNLMGEGKETRRNYDLMNYLKFH